MVSWPEIEQKEHFTSRCGDEVWVNAGFDTAMEVHRRVVNFLWEHNAWSAEDIMQKDGPQIHAPLLLAELIEEVLKSEVKYD